jgi:hypothetical protein
MTSRHRLPTLLAAGVATIAVAGCGGSSADDGSAGQQDDSKQLAFAQCLRKAGIDAPDPTTGPGGRVSQRIRVPRGISKQRVGQITADCARKTGGGPKPMSKEDQAKFRDAALKFARCMRAHGVNMPDPRSGENGGLVIGAHDQAGTNSSGPPPAAMQRAESACRHYLGAMKPLQLSEADQRKMRDAILRNARCMRAHGVNFPDPTFSASGAATIKGGPGGFDPNSPIFKRAQKACAGTLPGAVVSRSAP